MRRTPVTNQLPWLTSLTSWLPHSLTDWLTKWVSEWLTDSRSANDNWNCLWLPTWFQFRLRLQPGKTKQNKKGSHNFLRYWCAFHGPPKTQQFLLTLGPTALLMGPRAACRERGRGRSVEQEDSRDKVAGNRRKQLLIDFGLSFGIWQISCLSCRCCRCRWRCRKDRWKRSTSCVHVAALSTQPSSLPFPLLLSPLLDPRHVPTPFALTNVCRLLIEAAKLANSRKAAAQKKKKKPVNGRGSWAAAEKIETNVGGREEGGREGAIETRPQISALISSQTESTLQQLNLWRNTHSHTHTNTCICPC